MLRILRTSMALSRVEITKVRNTIDIIYVNSSAQEMDSIRLELYIIEIGYLASLIMLYFSSLYLSESGNSLAMAIPNTILFSRI